MIQHLSNADIVKMHDSIYEQIVASDQSELQFLQGFLVFILTITLLTCVGLTYGIITFYQVVVSLDFMTIPLLLGSFSYVSVYHLARVIDCPSGATSPALLTGLTVLWASTTLALSQYASYELFASLSLAYILANGWYIYHVYRPRRHVYRSIRVIQDSLTAF